MSSGLGSDKLVSYQLYTIGDYQSRYQTHPPPPPKVSIGCFSKNCADFKNSNKSLVYFFALFVCVAMYNLKNLMQGLIEDSLFS